MMPILQMKSGDEGQRLDVMLVEKYPEVSRSFLQKWIRQGHVTLEGHILKQHYRINGKEKIIVADFEKTFSPSGRDGRSATKEGLSLPTQQASQDRLGRFILTESQFPAVPTVLFEDEAMLVLDKPAGLVVHPAAGHHGDTLVDWLKIMLAPHVLQQFPDPNRLGIVHRLDKETSGVILVAKTIQAQLSLSKQFQSRSVCKTYAAFVIGVPQVAQGIITAPIGRSKKDPLRMAVTPLGKVSETSFVVEKIFDMASLLQIQPKTGRTHQIRVHLAGYGFPIAGDRLYGGSNDWTEAMKIKRPMLHAESLEIEDPQTQKRKTFKAKWPVDMKQLLLKLKKTIPLLLLSCCLLNQSIAETTTTSSSATSKSTTKKSSAAYLRLKKEMDALRSETDDLTSQLADLKDQWDKLGASKRLHDLEQAISEINGKAVAGLSTSEEAKTQALDANRKVKSLQETVDELRDQLDRLQQRMTQKTGDAAEATPLSSHPKPMQADATSDKDNSRTAAP